MFKQFLLVVAAAILAPGHPVEKGRFDVRIHYAEVESSSWSCFVK